jgi:FkbM family methyltransferase
MPRGLQKLLWGAKNLIGIAPRDERETFARLSWNVGRQPRHTDGHFQFPFGDLRYVDALVLKYQYREIFIQRGYDFACSHDSPLILDCGGNIGLSVVWFKQRYPKSRVTVFEADPSIAEIPTSNMAALKLRNVEIVQAAVWNQTGTVAFAADGPDAGRIKVRDGHREVRSVRLADFVTDPVDLLKLDIEGAEYSVVSDLYVTGKLHLVNRLICEIHSRPEERHQIADLLSALVEGGFKFSFNHARSAPDLCGDAEVTPFASVPDGKCLLHLYAWRS